MSERSLRRAHARRLERARRRASLGALLGAGALAAAPGVASAESFTVDTKDDGAATTTDCTTPVVGQCSLRDAIEAADAAAGGDAVSFASGLSGTIRLTEGALRPGSGDPLTIDGPGATVIAVSGDKDGSGTPTPGDSRIALNENIGPFTIRGLTLTGGFSDITGGAISSTAPLVLEDVRVVGNTATTDGGGVYATDALTVRRSEVRSNAGEDGGGLYAARDLTVTDSTLAQNTATGLGGGATSNRRATLQQSTITGNRANSGGGLELSSTAADLVVRDSRITGNTATAEGGGVRHSHDSAKYTVPTTVSEISRSTIADNAAGTDGGGVWLGQQLNGDRFAITDSTLSGNDAGASGFGGGLVVAFGLGGAALRMQSTTVSGNRAGTGAGVSFADGSDDPLLSAGGSVRIDGSTIAANAAATSGGGVFVGANGSPQTSPTVGIGNAIVAANAPEDVDRKDGSTEGGVAASFSLVQARGDGVPGDGTGNRFGVAPLLGALADNGGPTLTMLPAATSPALDAGVAPSDVAVDQRGRERRVDQASIANASGSDGADMGSVELAQIAPVPPEPPATATTTTTTSTTPTAPPQRSPPRSTSRDTRPPTSRVLRVRSKGKATTITGSASSDTRSVRVAVWRAIGKRCRFLQANGRFTAARSCSRRVTLRASGTRAWTLRLKRLPRGTYRFASQATDRAGNAQRRSTIRTVTRRLR